MNQQVATISNGLLKIKTYTKLLHTSHNEIKINKKKIKFDIHITNINILIYYNINDYCYGTC